MRLLSDLVGNDVVRHGLPVGWEDIDVGGITADSRAVRAGYVFMAVPGVKMDGRQFIPEAVKKGAVAILTSELPEGMSVPAVPVLRSHNIRHSVAMMAARFYARQPRWVAAVTGTDGKTSTAHFYQQLWRLMGHKAASIGTLGVVATDGLPEYPAVNTTPDPVLLHATLADMAAHGVEHVAMEASSHGLDQHRLDGVQVQVAGFTNLSRDHLDYHGSEEAYFAAKRRLFTEVMSGGGVAVLNADESHYEALRQASKASGHKAMGYGRNGDVLKLLALEPHATGQHARLEISGEPMELDIPLIGGFQVMNILCAAGMALASGADAQALAAAIGQLGGVPGRLEQVAVHHSGAPIFVDYAHTPGGLESVLSHIRPHVQGKLVVVFGCGGDRDKGKRPQMGRIAAQLADRVFVTDDNPRSERPDAIRAQVMYGCPNAQNIGGRMEAIIEAVRGLEQGDALVVAGKGHEKMQIIGDVTHPFDDAEVAKKAVSLMKQV
jgi:UDP-N-acetylmuramoyl-L-alanyl-D-glutamate--2,6-diaminopimelate ligase